MKKGVSVDEKGVLENESDRGKDTDKLMQNATVIRAETIPTQRFLPSPIWGNFEVQRSTIAPDIRARFFSFLQRS
jgi:hypothetical protein